MSDALPRNITLIGRLKKEWSRISRDIYSESYTSRQEIVPVDESTQAGAKEKPPLPGALISNGAAYRIRTYDVLIRSQTLYPAEVTPQRTDYYARDPSMGQATIWKNFMKHRLSSFADPHRLRPPAGALARSLKTLRVFFTLAPRPRFESMRCFHKRKAPIAGGFQFQLVRRIGFEPMTF